MTVNHGVPGSSPGGGASLKRGQKRPLFLFLTPPVSFNQGFLSPASFLKGTTGKMYLDAAVIFN